MTCKACGRRRTVMKKNIPATTSTEEPVVVNNQFISSIKKIFKGDTKNERTSLVKNKS